MKPLLLIFLVYLVLGSLMPNSDFSQLKRFTELRSHYSDHILEADHTEQQVSFLQFLKLHFISPADHHEADHEEDHQKLPLQTFDFSLTFLGFLSSSLSSHPIFSDNIRLRPEMRYILNKGFPLRLIQPPTCL